MRCFGRAGRPQPWPENRGVSPSHIAASAEAAGLGRGRNFGFAGPPNKENNIVEVIPTTVFMAKVAMIMLVVNIVSIL